MQIALSFIDNLLHFQRTRYLGHLKLFFWQQRQSKSETIKCFKKAIYRKRLRFNYFLASSPERGSGCGKAFRLKGDKSKNTNSKSNAQCLSWTQSRQCGVCAIFMAKQCRGQAKWQVAMGQCATFVGSSNYRTELKRAEMETSSSSSSIRK